MAEEFVQRAVEQQGEAARCLGPTTRTGQGCVGCDEAEGDEEAEDWARLCWVRRGRGGRGGEGLGKAVLGATRPRETRRLRTGQGCVGCDEAEGDEEAEALSLNVEGDLGGAGWNGGGKKRTMKRKRPLEWDVCGWISISCKNAE
jgi:hypothetical protein